MRYPKWPKINPVNMTAETPKVIFPIFNLPKKTPVPMASIIATIDCVTVGTSPGNKSNLNQSNIFSILVSTQN